VTEEEMERGMEDGKGIWRKEEGYKYLYIKENEINYFPYYL
jgi:hypothetical protein